MNRSAGVAVAMHACQAREIERLNRELDFAYRRLKQSAPPALAQAWTDAQRAWSSYRQAECDFVSASEQNGLGVGMWVDIANGCLMDMTIARARLMAGSVRDPIYRSRAFDACRMRRPERSGPSPECVNTEGEQLDRALNMAYRSLRETASADDRQDWRQWYLESLRKSERAWLDYRDAECTLAGVRAAHAGQLEGVARDNCRLWVVAARVDELQRARGEILELLGPPSSRPHHR